MAAGAYGALCAFADRRGLRVFLEIEEGERPFAERAQASRLSRIRVEDRNDDEVAAARITKTVDLEGAATALLEYLERKVDA